MWGKGFLGRITQSNLIFISLLNYDTSDRTFTSSFLYTKFALILYVNHTSNTSVCYRKLPPSFFTSKIRKILIPQLLYPYMKEIGQSFKETVIQNFKNFRIIQVVLIKLLQIAECRYTRKFTKGDYSTYLHHFTLLLLWQTLSFWPRAPLPAQSRILDTTPPIILWPKHLAKGTHVVECFISAAVYQRLSQVHGLNPTWGTRVFLWVLGLSSHLARICH